MAQWKRKEFTTRGADPTTVVEWDNGKFMIQEFQNVYTVRETLAHVPAFLSTASGPLAALGEELHKQLENQWETVQRAGKEDEEYEVGLAERKAGWDPNP